MFRKEILITIIIALVIAIIVILILWKGPFSSKKEVSSETTDSEQVVNLDELVKQNETTVVI